MASPRLQREFVRIAAGAEGALRFRGLIDAALLARRPPLGPEECAVTRGATVELLLSLGSPAGTVRRRLEAFRLAGTLGGF